MKNILYCMALACCIGLCAMDEACPKRMDMEAFLGAINAYAKKVFNHIPTPKPAVEIQHYTHTVSSQDEKSNNDVQLYTLFCRLPRDIQQRIVYILGVTSTTAQKKFFSMKVGKAFEYYAVCQHSKSSLPIDLHFMLDTKRQGLFLEAVFNGTTKFAKTNVPSLPKMLEEEQEYQLILSKTIHVEEEKPWRNSTMVTTLSTTIKQYAVFY